MRRSLDDATSGRVTRWCLSAFSYFRWVWVRGTVHLCHIDSSMVLVVGLDLVANYHEEKH